MKNPKITGQEIIKIFKSGEFQLAFGFPNKFRMSLWNNKSHTDSNHLTHVWSSSNETVFREGDGELPDYIKLMSEALVQLSKENQELKYQLLNKN